MVIAPHRCNGAHDQRLLATVKLKKTKMGGKTVLLELNRTVQNVV